MKLFAIAGTVALALAGVGAAGGTDPAPIACTEIGCASGVHIQLDRLPSEARSARVCVDGRCGRKQPLSPGSGGGFVEARLPKGKRRARASVGVRIVVLDREGRVLARSRTRGRVRRTQPNGGGCPPVCFQVGLHYRGDRGLTGE